MPVFRELDLYFLVSISSLGEILSSFLNVGTYRILKTWHKNLGFLFTNATD
jgi:hypothetical protein